MKPKAPISQLAKQILEDPDASRQLRTWLDTGKPTGIITVGSEQDERLSIRARRLQTIEATHGQERPHKPFTGRIKAFFAELLLTLLGH